MGNPERVPVPSRDGLRSAKLSSVQAQMGNPERVPVPSRDGLRSAKLSSVHAIISVELR
jgi:hypothetical protein